VHAELLGEYYHARFGLDFRSLLISLVWESLVHDLPTCTVSTCLETVFYIPYTIYFFYKRVRIRFGKALVIAIGFFDLLKGLPPSLFQVLALPWCHLIRLCTRRRNHWYARTSTQFLFPHMIPFFSRLCGTDISRRIDHRKTPLLPRTRHPTAYDVHRWLPTSFVRGNFFEMRDSGRQATTACAQDMENTFNEMADVITWDFKVLSTTDDGSSIGKPYCQNVQRGRHELHSARIVRGCEISSAWLEHRVPSGWQTKNRWAFFYETACST